jgi:hypothetical protein
MGEQAGMDRVDSASLDHLKQFAELLQAIEQRLVILAPADETLDYPEAARRAGISERKLSELVNTGRLVEGFHFLRIDAVVRFPPNIARRLFLKPPAAKARPQAQPHRPKSPQASRLNRPEAKGKRTGTRPSFNLDY